MYTVHNLLKFVRQRQSNVRGRPEICLLKQEPVLFSHTVMPLLLGRRRAAARHFVDKCRWKMNSFVFVRSAGANRQKRCDAKKRKIDICSAQKTRFAPHVALRRRSLHATFHHHHPVPRPSPRLRTPQRPRPPQRPRWPRTPMRRTTRRLPLTTVVAFAALVPPARFLAKPEELPSIRPKCYVTTTLPVGRNSNRTD